jgi:hypothetical protein
MRLRHLKLVLSLALLGCILAAALEAQDEKRKDPGADFQHAIYLPKPFTAKGIGDASVRRDIFYILRLEEGEELTAAVSSTSEEAREPNTILVSLVDGSATSLHDAKVIVYKPAKPQGKNAPGKVAASITYLAPKSGDYYLVVQFNGPGISFELTTHSRILLPANPSVQCAQGRLTKPHYITEGLPDSLIRDVAIGDPRVNPPDEQNRNFCLTSCEVRPPTSHVLTAILQTAFDSEKQVKACWDSTNTVTAVTLSH